MAKPRSQRFDPSKPPWVHGISRCMRRTFLCGRNLCGRNRDGRDHARDTVLHQGLANLPIRFSCRPGISARVTPIGPGQRA